MHLSIEIPTPTPPHPPTPGQGGGMWGIFMAFEGTVCLWGWGISQHLHSHIHRAWGARWGFDSCLVSSRQFLHMVTGVARGWLDFVQLFGSTSGFER